ncbi:MAG: acetoacetate decarboxylase family protein [Anaerolineales bacterium]|nr:acetoacetate decarboxylase family protein [Anaerolineales bacterium]
MKISISMPNAAPYYPPPPFHFKDNIGFNIIFRTAPEVLQAWVPAPLIPNSANYAFVYVGAFHVDSPAKMRYQEAGIGVPVQLNGKPGNFFVYLYLDQALAIVAGREIWGWPKKDAEIQFAAQGRQFQASVRREGVEIINASVHATDPVLPVPDPVDVPSYNLKIIPSVQRNHPPDVLQLTSAGGTSKRKILFRGAATLGFASSPNDPLGEIPILEIVSAEQYVEDMSLDYGEVVVDYLAAGGGDDEKLPG